MFPMSYRVKPSPVNDDWLTNANYSKLRRMPGLELLDHDYLGYLYRRHKKLVRTLHGNSDNRADDFET